ncbi:MAG: putative metal-binding motif-containing protein, partial [Polyangiaceae bacterium]|nr:putative metal-binding motif-containing protein [Polyangiaceae bacterium]
GNTIPLDCAEGDPTVGGVEDKAAEICDGKDNDCNGVKDDPPLTNFGFDLVPFSIPCDGKPHGPEPTPKEVNNINGCHVMAIPMITNFPANDPVVSYDIRIDSVDRESISYTITCDNAPDKVLSGRFVVLGVPPGQVDPEPPPPLVTSIFQSDPEITYYGSCNAGVASSSIQGGEGYVYLKHAQLSSLYPDVEGNGVNRIAWWFDRRTDDDSIGQFSYILKNNSDAAKFTFNSYHVGFDSSRYSVVCDYMCIKPADDEPTSIPKLIPESMTERNDVRAATFVYPYYFGPGIVPPGKVFASCPALGTSTSSVCDKDSGPMQEFSIDISGENAGSEWVDVKAYNKAPAGSNNFLGVVACVLVPP